ncbi:SpvB/TcaC N-terminal domain-containing protein [Gaetbulibacter jejuensis]|uniref:Insecticide toxin TcdB middle/N-terminal domain-containing protein n=1 Tax=Gaetbulibacter jejuensis TaxID=584607 RepID=A0ABP3V8L8_9FLAO
MHKPFFKSLRTSYFVGTLLTSLLSNVLVFGQPIEQILSRTDRFQPNINCSSQYDYINKYHTGGKVAYIKSNVKTTTSNSVKDSASSVFHALESQAIIGISKAIEKENPRDNFFTLHLPESIDFDHYDMVLTYDLYGVSAAEQTTKSINSFSVYGGQTLKLNNTWTRVEEHLLKGQLKAGNNEIFFNRRADVPYLYKVKNLQVKLVEKRSKRIHISTERLVNYSGKIHLLGFVEDGSTLVEALGRSIPVKDGVFETILDEVPKGLKHLSIRYGEGLSLEGNFEVVYNDAVMEYVFTDEPHKGHSLIKHPMQAPISLEALTVKNFSNIPTVTESQLQVGGVNFEALRPVNSDVVNVTSGVFLGYSIKTSGITDSTNFELHLKYDKTKIPVGYSDKDVRTFAFDRKKREWIALPVTELDYANSMVVSEYSGDTDYINGVIKVPEMAETSSFTPTTITDMEYANPSAGVVSIAPPAPNSNGIASTYFPIKLPTGRNGMMPSLSVNYNSEAGNGWMGVGWNLQLPAITLDTRWGTPRFDTYNESEIYQLNGETLVQKVGSDYTNPHRYDGIMLRNDNTSSNGEKLFYLRKEGSYFKIIRWGNSPKNYIWQVWDKYGNMNWYGGSKYNGIYEVDENSVVRDENDNITHWALNSSSDTYGNWVDYYYDKDESISINGVSAQSFQPRWIQYTKKAGVDNFYEVKFITNNGSVNIIRDDIQLNARTGTMMATQDLLTKILIRYKDDDGWKVVRSYEFDYIESTFKKMQLSKISEYDTEGNLFYSNTMEYYDELGTDQIINAVTPVTWGGSSVDFNGVANIVTSGSALGTGTTSGFSLGVRGGAGIGTNPTTVTSTIGSSYNYSQSKEKTKISFIDINGDGLPDKVYKTDLGLKYQPNLGTLNGFGAETSITNITELDNTKSRTNTFGFDANLGVGPLGVGEGRSTSRTRTETDEYFTDFNGDGLIDIASNNIVNFNNTTPWDSDSPIVSFNTNSSLTANEITTGTLSQDVINSLELESIEKLRSDYSQFDHVKVWVAPYSGTINIASVATLLQSNTCDDYTNSFRLTIEKANSNQDTGNTQSIAIGANNAWYLSSSNSSENINKQGVQVEKRDKLFFRIHNEEYGCGGTVAWNPAISYSSTSATTFNTTNDEHNTSFLEFDATTDYMINNGGSWSPSPEDNTISFNTYFGVNQLFQNGLTLSDDTRFVIEKTTYQHDTDETIGGEPNPNYGQIDETNIQVDTIVYTYNHEDQSVTPSGASTSQMAAIPNQFANAGAYSYAFRFYVESDSNVQWNTIGWQPIIFVNGTEVHYPGVSYFTYDNNVNETQYAVAGTDLPTPIIDPNTANDSANDLLKVSHNMFDQNLDYSQFDNIHENAFPIKINWVSKTRINGVATTIDHDTFYVHRETNNSPLVLYDYVFKIGANPNSANLNGSNSFDNFTLTKGEVEAIVNAPDGMLYSAFYMEHQDFALNNPTSITFELISSEQNNYPSFTLKTLSKPFFAQQSSFFGMTYRGWGQFLYNGGINYHYNQENGDLIVDNGNIVMDVFDGNIDMSVFASNSANAQDLNDQVDNGEASSTAIEAIRYLLYHQDNADLSYDAMAIIVDVDDTTGERAPATYGFDNTTLVSKLGRFGEPNLQDIHISEGELTNVGGSTSNFIGLRQRSFSKGTATDHEVSISLNEGSGEIGGSGTKSNGWSKVLNQYIDVNGDRYPDMITDGNIQFTSMKGGLIEHTLENTFVSGAENEDNTAGVTIVGVLPNSTSADNPSTSNPTRTNINSGINASSGTTRNSKMWVDINGDGLADQVTITEHSGVSVRLNLGYEFSANPVNWSTDLNLTDLNVSKRSNASGGGGVVTSSFGGGFGVGTSTANVTATLLDVNADGLPDLVKKTETNFKVYLNTGAGFEADALDFYNNTTIDQNRSTTGNLYGSATGGVVIPIPLGFITIPLKITGTATGGVSGGVNQKRITVQDIDGDGYPDVLQAGNNNDDVIAKLNKIGKTNLLKTVNTPLGGSWTIDYARAGNTYDLPHNKWVMHTIRTNDGFTADTDGGFTTTDETLTSVSYEHPKHDRREREFLGFGKVTTSQLDPDTDSTFRYSVVEYHTDNVYLKGLVKRTTVHDANEALLSEQTTLYNIMDPVVPQVNVNASPTQHYLQSGLSTDLLDYSRLFVAPVKTVATTFENAVGLSIEQHFTAYDGRGNLLTYRQLGEDAYRTEMEYYDYLVGMYNRNSIGFVKSIKVKRDSDGQLFRQRNAEYNNKGKLIKVTTTLNATETNTVTIGYDDLYGNPISYTQQNGFVTTIAYDPAVHTYPTQVSNSYNEVSTSSYEYRFGVPLLATDINGQQLRTRIDNRGRLVEVTAPNEMPNGWTLRMQYEGEVALPQLNGDYCQAIGSFEPGTTPTGAAKHHAVTRHFVDDAQNDQLLTVSLVDGMGSAIQLKKTQLVNDNDTNQLGWLVSGKEHKDPYGRVVAAYLPTFTSANYLGTIADYVTDQNTIPPTEMTYDSRDRTISVKQPDENDTATTVYSIADGMFLTTVTNELDQTFETHTDVRGRQRKTVQNGELTTQFYYNVIGEKIKVKNHQGYETFYKYDLAGRRIEERHPDHGLQTFTYDVMGNLKERYTSNLLSNGQQLPIAYEYDLKNRLIKVKYPQHPENNSTYTYGYPGNTDAEGRNAVGRLYMQEDASGVQGFGYDKLGNLNHHLRGVAVAGRHTYWYNTQWTYDSHNRVKSIIYPDGERVDYNYNLGGALDHINRFIDGGVASDQIVSNIQYNALGERTQITYGNGTSTSYTYDNRRRLKDLSHQFTGFGLTNRYGYDALSNVTSVATQNAQNSIPSTGQLGGPISHTYKYDDYNRLVYANGRYTGPNDFTTPLLAQEYSLDMRYDLAHNIVSKTQTHVQGAVTGYGSAIDTPETMIKTNYHLDYAGYATGVNVIQGQGDEYGYVQPHAPREIVETPDSGSLTIGDPEYKKKLIDYDANGNQTSIKQVIVEASQGPAYEGVVEQHITTLQRNLWDEEDRLRAVDLNPEDTKQHPIAVYTYDASGQRVVRYVPTRLDVRSNAYAVSQNAHDEIMLYPSPLVTAKALSDPNQQAEQGDLISSYTKHYYIGAERIQSTLGTVRDLGLYPPKIEDMFEGIRTKADTIVQVANTGLSATYTALNQSISLGTCPYVGDYGEGNLQRYAHDADSYDAYWYHRDHLGSSSYISNRDGYVTQHMEYLPFGETLVDEHQNSYNTPYKFNGKELDDETGNYYYGARYYNPKWSVWLSVDPLAEKYASWSTYNYTMLNPVRLIDPTGMGPEDPDGKGNTPKPVARRKERTEGNPISKLLFSIFGVNGSSSNSSTSTKGSSTNGGRSRGSYRRERTSSNGFSFSTSDGQVYGPQDLKTITDGTVQDVNVDAFMILVGYAKGKKRSSGGDVMTNARTNAKNFDLKNEYKTLMDEARQEVKVVDPALDFVDLVIEENLFGVDDSSNPRFYRKIILEGGGSYTVGYDNLQDAKNDSVKLMKNPDLKNGRKVKSVIIK